MNKNPPDERLVYLALKHTFKGANAQVRKTKNIRKLILKRKDSFAVRELIREHEIDSVCKVAKLLLEARIFESTLQAKVRFPEGFEVSPAQSAERSASEQEAAKPEANAIRVAAGGQKAGELEEESREYVVYCEEPCASLQESTAQLGHQRFPHATISVPSLYPVYLPYRTQHQLLAKVQGILEKTCYDFGLRTLKETLDDQGWDCAESVELNRWPRLFLLNQEKFRQEDVASLGKPLAELLNSITQLRHTAVHRLRIRANQLEQFMVDAEALARVLQDDHQTQKLARLRRETQLTIGELKSNKDFLESNLSSELKKIADQRAELDRLEDEAVKRMLRHDKEYQILAGTNLDQAIHSPDTAIHSPAPSDTDITSEVDLGDSEGDLETGIVAISGDLDE